MTQLIDPNMCLTTLTWTSVDPCSSMLWSRSRTRLTPHSHSEDLAEKASAVPVQWTLMAVTIWLAFAQSTRKISRSQLFHHSCSCSSLRTWSPICLTSTLSINQSILILSASKPRSLVRENSSSLLRIESFLMVFTSACSVLAASQLAHLIGGTLRTTWDLLCSCRLTGGLLTLVMSSLMRDSRSSAVTWNLESATKLVSALLPAPRVSTLEEHWSISNPCTKNIKCARNPNSQQSERLFEFYTAHNNPKPSLINHSLLSVF